MYEKVKSEKTLELENVRIQEEMMEFFRELVGERWIKVRVGGSILQSNQTDFGILHGGVLSVTLFLVAINGIFGELKNK